MRASEFSPLPLESFTYPSTDGSEVRYARGPFRRRAKLHQHSSGDSPAMPVAPERQDLDVHRERVADQVRATFDAVDAGVRHMIGYSGGNIREELRRRLVSTGPHSHQRRLDTNGLDPALQGYLQNDIFFFRLDNSEEGPAAIYQVDCQVGRFVPSIQVEKTDGFVEATLFTGPNNDEFDTVQIRRVYNDGNVRELTTFTPNYRDPYGPPHPLVISQGPLRGRKSQVIYDNIDEAGNVTPLHGQIVTDPFPLQTNIYVELEAIGSSIGAIGQ